MTDYKPRKKHHYFWWFAVIIVLLFGIFSVSLSIKTQLTLNQITVKNEGDPLPDVYLDLPTPGLLPEIKDSFIKPDPEPDRLDVLLLGIRGVDDPDNRNSERLISPMLKAAL
ncbi:MAG: hypothetical protein UY09_C0055G0003 [Parcubacteria group bacterium GW2011_GWA2_47_8]|nr:MAG: hypothetical protein UY09_C0055G0003 [Parcubacteria group bacterium GW2011_GWA2_47_8]